MKKTLESRLSRKGAKSVVGALLIGGLLYVSIPAQANVDNPPTGIMETTAVKKINYAILEISTLYNPAVNNNDLLDKHVMKNHDYLADNQVVEEDLSVENWMKTDWTSYATFNLADDFKEDELIVESWMTGNWN